MSATNYGRLLYRHITDLLDYGTERSAAALAENARYRLLNWEAINARFNNPAFVSRLLHTFLQGNTHTAEELRAADKPLRALALADGVDHLYAEIRDHLAKLNDST